MVFFSCEKADAAATRGCGSAKFSSSFLVKDHLVSRPLTYNVLVLCFQRHTCWATRWQSKQQKIYTLYYCQGTDGLCEMSNRWDLNLYSF